MIPKQVEQASDLMQSQSKQNKELSRVWMKNKKEKSLFLQAKQRLELKQSAFSSS